MDNYFDDDEDDFLDDDRDEELEAYNNCHCGALQLVNGKVIQIADCNC